MSSFLRAEGRRTRIVVVGGKLGIGQPCCLATIGRGCMPIEYYIDHARRLVVARGIGVFTEADVFGYQREVWSQSAVAGYDELVDMTEVKEIATPLPDGRRMTQLASEAAAQDHPTKAAKLAIVAPNPLALGL